MLARSHRTCSSTKRRVNSWPSKTVAPLSLFESDYHYAREGLGYLHAQDRLANGPRLHPDHASIELQPDDDLARYLKQQLADEMRPADGVYVVSASSPVVQSAIETARNTDAWPTTQYLWPLHPMLQWMDFKMLSLIGRQRAPVIRVQRGVANALCADCRPINVAGS